MLPRYALVFTLALSACVLDDPDGTTSDGSTGVTSGDATNGMTSSSGPAPVCMPPDDPCADLQALCETVAASRWCATYRESCDLELERTDENSEAAPGLCAGLTGQCMMSNNAATCEAASVQCYCILSD